MLEQLDKNRSNWVFNNVESLYIHTTEYDPLSGSSYMELPKELYLKKTLINIKKKTMSALHGVYLGTKTR